ncbi:hypothetical protein VNO77_02635 [Canavalia gladiata]|uniref:Uncharacterized protein n=1 Tax=Canavalia gladiata TaxID=3824 RepID=A0AAN9MU02_CANGL
MHVGGGSQLDLDSFRFWLSGELLSVSVLAGSALRKFVSLWRKRRLNLWELRGVFRFCFLQGRFCRILLRFFLKGTFSLAHQGSRLETRIRLVPISPKEEG